MVVMRYYVVREILEHVILTGICRISILQGLIFQTILLLELLSIVFYFLEDYVVIILLLELGISWTTLYSLLVVYDKQNF
jgi:hypothetical protein